VSSLALPEFPANHPEQFVQTERQAAQVVAERLFPGPFMRTPREDVASLGAQLIRAAESEVQTLAENYIQFYGE
jgi:hypothetical protein